MAPFSKPQKTPSGRPSHSDIFSRYGGRITVNQFNKLVSRLPMLGIPREYVKRVMEGYHNPGSPHITRKEFLEGLEKMRNNTRDPVDTQLIERIKRSFGFK